MEPTLKGLLVVTEGQNCFLTCPIINTKYFIDKGCISLNLEPYRDHKTSDFSQF